MWRIAFSEEREGVLFSDWVSSLPVELRRELLSALKIMRDSVESPWQLNTENTSVSKLPDEYPAIFDILAALKDGDSYCATRKHFHAFA